MEIKTFRLLPEDAVRIRKCVFIQEQGFAEEFDAIDRIAVHLVLYQNAKPIATCRYYWDMQKESHIIGRIAVVKEYRGKSIGAYIVREAEQQIESLGGKTVFLAAQKQAVGFYEKQNYAMTGSAFYEEHCPHIWMYKHLTQHGE